MENIRQGDILLKKVEMNDKEKSRLKYIGEGRRILAYGEVTGHSHQLIGTDTKFYDNGNGQILCSVNGDAELVHQEHKIIPVPVGDYLVIKQRESDLITGIVREVLD